MREFFEALAQVHLRHLLRCPFPAFPHRIPLLAGETPGRAAVVQGAQRSRAYNEWFDDFNCVRRCPLKNSLLNITRQFDSGRPQAGGRIETEENPRNAFWHFHSGRCLTKYVANEEHEAFQTHMYGRDQIVEPDGKSDLPAFGWHANLA